jgi:coenzyme F420-reducing hydrogenase gamma subunit
VTGKKLKIGWFSFTCCEDSTMVWVEMMNENYFKWKDLLDIRHARVLRRINELENIDVAFVEGAITTESDARKLRSIRKNSKRLVAIGSCAMEAMPAGQRNSFDPELKEQIDFLVKRFKQTDRVRSLKEIVQVDDGVPGCPMEEGAFLRVLDKYLKEFGVIHA